MMTKARAKQYWRILKGVKDMSNVEATLVAEAILVLNTPVKKRLTKRTIPV